MRQAYLSLSLALWGGLRRKEADLLTWKQAFIEEGLIHIRRTECFEPKTEESQRSIDIPAAAVDVLRKFKKGRSSEFVLEGNDPHPTATCDYYRADHTWRTLIEWLKGKGITDVKAIHSLRKKSGSLIAASFGIEAARQHLGHPCRGEACKRNAGVRRPMLYADFILSDLKWSLTLACSPCEFYVS